MSGMATNVPSPHLKLGGSYEVRFSPVGDLVAAIDHELTVWNLETREVSFSKRLPFKPSSIDFSPDGSHIVAKCTSGPIALVEVRRGSLIRYGENEGAWEGCEALYSPCGKYLVDGDWEGHLRVQKASTGEVVFCEHDPHMMICHLSYSADRRIFACSMMPATDTDDYEYHQNGGNRAQIVIRPWPFDKGVLRVIKLHTDIVGCMSLSPSGRRLVVIGQSHPWLLQTISVKSGRLIRSRQFRAPGSDHELAWSLDESLIGYAGGDAFTIFDADSLQPLRVIPDETPWSLSFSPGQRFVAFGSKEKGRVFSLDALNIRRASPSKSSKTRRKRR